MAVAPWPSTLEKYFNEAGFNFQFGKQVLRSAMDVGPEKVRRLTTRPVNQSVGTVRLKSLTDVDTFMTFFNTTINGGVSQFSFADPLTGLTANYRFVSEPSITPAGGVEFTLNMQLEKLP